MQDPLDRKPSKAAGAERSSLTPATGTQPGQKLGQPGIDTPFMATVVLPSDGASTAGDPIQLQLLPTDCVHDVRQWLLDIPECGHYTCYGLELNGNRLNDVAEFSTIEGLSSEITLRVRRCPRPLFFLGILPESDVGDSTPASDGRWDRNVSTAVPVHQLKGIERGH